MCIFLSVIVLRDSTIVLGFDKDLNTILDSHEGIINGLSLDDSGDPIKNNWVRMECPPNEHAHIDGVIPHWINDDNLPDIAHRIKKIRDAIVKLKTIYDNKFHKINTKYHATINILSDGENNSIYEREKALTDYQDSLNAIGIEFYESVKELKKTDRKIRMVKA